MFRRKIAYTYLCLIFSVLVMAGCGSYNPSSPQPQPASLRFALVANSHSNSVSTFVVDPTTAGVSLPNAGVDLNVAALGAFSTVTNSCNLAGNPVPLLRPSSGVAAADICLFSAGGLDTSMTYTVSGPGDVAVIAKLPAGLGIIHLTLQVPAAAATGVAVRFVFRARRHAGGRHARALRLQSQIYVLD